MDTGHLGKLYADGETIIAQGEVGNCMYIIQSGEVSVSIVHDGHATELRRMGAGDFIGEMAIFEKQARSATVRAVGEARVLTVDRKTFLGRITEDPSLAFRLVQTLSARVRDLSDELARLKTQPGSGSV